MVSFTDESGAPISETQEAQFEIDFPEFGTDKAHPVFFCFHHQGFPWSS